MNAQKSLLSLIITVYRGHALLDDTLIRLSQLVEELKHARVELIFVDDGSRDGSYEKILAYRNASPAEQVRAIRLSRNYGAMAALQAGIMHARGDCVAVLPQDLQDPPEAVVEMYRSWRDDGIKANFTVRNSERQEAFLKKAPALLYHYLFKKFVLPDYPQRGLGVFLLDRQIIDELRRHMPRHTDLVLYAFSLGYSCKLHPYPRPAAKQASAWVLAKQLKLALDNFIAFSYLPVRMMSIAGFGVALLGFMFAIYVFIAKATGWLPLSQPPGWATLVILITVCSGLIMTMLGIIGEYLWRILDNVRQFPPYLIDDIQPPAPAKETQEKRQETPPEQRK